MSADITLRDITDGWHLCVAAGLTSPTATAVTDTTAALLALAAALHGYRRPAVTLTAAVCASLLASTLTH